MTESLKIVPLNIILNKKSRTLEIEFDTGEVFILSCAALRKASLSADMRHGLKKDDYQDVNILAIEPVGQYAIKPLFSDGHQTGIYSWDTLYQIAQESGQRK